MDPELWRELEEGDPEEEIRVVVRRRDAAFVPAGLEIVADFGEVVTGRIRRDAVRELRAHPQIESVKAADELVPEVEPDEEVEQEGGPAEWVDERRPAGLTETGRGVIVSVLDWGCDFAHPDFRTEAGRTRIVALWDQRGGSRSGSPQPYGYGIVHNREAIDRALASPNPYTALGYHPADADSGSGSHGTHCLGIAAGNGRSGGPSGLAPQADIVFVHLTATRADGLANLGDSVTLLEAVDFVRRTAGERPFVLSVSVGNHGGPHDGLTLVEQAIDAVVGQRGAAVCQSAGNYFDKSIHAAGQLRPGTSRVLRWTTSAADVTENELEIWYPGVDVFEVELRAPTGERTRRVGLGERESLRIGSREAALIYHRAHDPNNLRNHVNAFIKPGAPAGAWEIEVHGVDVADGRFHCWVERDGACRDCQSVLDPADAVTTTTTGTICHGFRTIAVGAYDAHSTGRELGPFSSSGPSADGRQKPDLVAPGVRVLSARSTPRSGTAPPLTRKSGTSMAAPHVAGTVALMFEAAGRKLAIHETRSALLRAARVPAEISPENAARFGDGYMQTREAVEAARRLGAAPARAIPRAAPARALVGVGARTEASEAEAAELEDEMEQELDVIEPEDEMEQELEVPEVEDQVFEGVESQPATNGHLEQIWSRLERLETVAAAVEGGEELVEVQAPQGIEFAEDELEVSVSALLAYQPVGGRQHAPASDPAFFRCAPDPVAVTAATILPQGTTTPPAAVEEALRAAGVDAGQFEAFARGGGVAALAPVAATFGGPALSELVARLRYAPQQLVSPPHNYGTDAAAVRRLGVPSTAALLAPRLLLAVPGHFRELARRAPNAGEAFALENLGWLLMASLRAQIAAATRADWWTPPPPPYVTPFSSTLPAFSSDVQQLILRLGLIDTTLDYGSFFARFGVWANGPAGRSWQLETGLEPSPTGPGRPFYPGAATIPAAVDIVRQRAQVEQAWQRRLAEADDRFGADVSDAKTQWLRECDDAHLRPLNLMQFASLGNLRLVYNWPALRTDRAVSRVTVLRVLAPVFEQVFRTVYDLGWNDLFFQTSGAGCFRGIKHPPGATYHSAARRLSDHGYGIAIDVNVPENPQRRRRAGVPLPRAAMDPRVVALFEAFHFRWGHCFRSSSDPHHFEYCGGAC